MRSPDGDSLAAAILETVDLPLLSLDGEFRVEVANDAFLRCFDVSREETLGRFIYDLGNGQWNIPELRRLLGELLQRETLVTGYRVDHSFEQIGRRVMRLNAKRIRRTAPAGDSILLAITDDTERERLRDEVEGRIEFADKLIDSVREALLVLHGDLRVHSANQPFYELFKVERGATEECLVYELGNGQWNIPELRALLEDVLPKARAFDDYEVRHTFDSIGPRIMILNGRRLDHLDLILLAIRDVTEIRAADQARRDRERRHSLLLRFDDAIRPLTTSQAIYDEAARMLGEELDASRTAYLEMEDGRPVVRACHARGVAPLEGGYPFAQSDLESLRRAGGPVVVADTSLAHAGSDAKGYAELRIGAYVTVPLARDGRSAMGIAVHAAAPRAWRATEVQLIAEFAERTRAAVERVQAEAAIHEWEARFRALVEASSDVVYRMSADWAQMKHLVGRDFVPDTRAPSRSWIDIYIPPDDRSLVRRVIDEAIRNRTVFELEHRVMRGDGSLGWTLSRAVPILDRDGNIVEWFGLAADITQRKANEERLRAARDTFRRLVEHSPFGIYVVDADFRLVQISDGARKTFENVSPLIGRDFAEILRTIWREPFASEAIDRFRRTLDTGEPYRSPGTVETRADTATTETYDWKIERIALPDGRPGVVCHFYDLSERQRSEEHVRLLMREVNHRSKNMLSLVQSIANQTAAAGLDDFKLRFSERLQSLAVSQELLVRNAWKAIPIADLIREQLDHFADLVGTRISCDGPPLLLTSRATQALGMAIHELATNAAKYGAFSNATGRVDVAWSCAPGQGEEDRFVLSWRETGGPAVSAPRRRGFGSSVISKLIEMNLNGHVSMEFESTGLRWRFSCDASNVLESAAAFQGAAARPSARPARGRRVLVVEDEAVIAVEMADLLAAAGFDVIGPVADSQRAIELLKRDGCDAAVLDVNLRHGTSEPLARELVSAGTPFLVVTGYSSAQLPPAFAGATVLTKPLRGATLAKEVERCLDAARTRFARQSARA